MFAKAVVDPDLQLREGGGGSHRDPEKRGRLNSKKIFLGPSGLSLV